MSTLRLLFVMRGRKVLAGDIARAQATVRQIDPGAFITVDKIQPLQRGYFQH